MASYGVYPLQMGQRKMNYQIDQFINLITGCYKGFIKMATDEEISLLIEKAAEAAGSQTRLAEIIGMPKSHITQMKQGKRHVNWRVRGKLRAVLGEDPAHAFTSAMLEDLEGSDNEDEKKAAEGLKAMLAAFPNDWRRL